MVLDQKEFMKYFCSPEWNSGTLCKIKNLELVKLTMNGD